MGCSWVVHGLYRGCTQVVWSLYTGCILVVYELYTSCMRVVRRLYMGCMQVILGLQRGCKGVGMYTDGTLHVKGCKQGEIQFSDKQTNGQTDRDTSAGVELRLCR